VFYGLALDATAQLLSRADSGTAAPHQGTGHQSLKKTLTQLERRFKVTFAFDERVIQPLQVSTQLVGKDLEEILSGILPGLNLTFTKVRDKLYVIQDKGVEHQRPRATSSGADPVQLSPASVTFVITGRVTADQGNGLPGVNVLLKGSTTGTTTDSEGNYALNVTDTQANGTLVFSFIGYLTEEIAIGNRNVLNVSLLPDIKSLSEVVVVGYGTQEKKELTGAVSSVRSEDIRQVAVTGLDQALQGRAPGVVVTNNSGEPGGSVSVKIRGRRLHQRFERTALHHRRHPRGRRPQRHQSQRHRADRHSQRRRRSGHLRLPGIQRRGGRNHPAGQNRQTDCGPGRLPGRAVAGQKIRPAQFGRVREPGR
jgi:hypothetical protein